jgi:hypothetical protein
MRARFGHIGQRESTVRLTDLRVATTQHTVSSSKQVRSGGNVRTWLLFLSFCCFLRASASDFWFT